MPTIIFRPENILISLFNYFPTEKREFPADREKIHRAFYSLKQEEPKLLEEFIFDADRIFPVSEVLDQALNNLEFSRYIEKFNPSLDHYRLKPVINSYFSEKLSEEFSGHLGTIKSLSAILQDYLIA